MTERRWYSIREAAEYFGLPSKTFYFLAARKRLPVGAVLRIGRAIRIDVTRIEAAALKDRHREGRAD